MTQHRRMPSPLGFIQSFLKVEANGGLLLMGAAATALVLANSPLSPAYFTSIESRIGGLSVIHWINDGLMAAFFLLVGLEIKREFVGGHLKSWKKRVLPGVAALGGMVVPAAIYLSVNLGSDGAPRGWAIPAATDIAFALGILSLLGSRVPLSLKIFLTALAIIDDLGAVLIIAAFYTAELTAWALAGVAAVSASLVALNRAGVTRLLPYLGGGVVLWFFMLQSGVHATVAGVILAFAIPFRSARSREDSPLLRLESGLHPWVTFLIVPIFGLANAGVSLQGASLESIYAPVPLGVALGLFLGKQAGVFLFAWIAVRAAGVSLPAGASWTQLFGVSVFCGIGFTMSLFIGSLAFAGDSSLQDAAKVGVLIGSVLSALFGAAVLLLSARK